MLAATAGSPHAGWRRGCAWYLTGQADEVGRARSEYEQQGDFLDNLNALDAVDEGARMVLFQLVKKLGGRAVIDLTDLPPQGWSLQVQDHARHVVLIAEGKSE
jgi:hypothetical protein